MEVVTPGGMAARLGETGKMMGVVATITAVGVATDVEAREERRVLVVAHSAAKEAPSPEPTGAAVAARGLHEVLGKLCKTWPRRWDEYIQPALWIHRTTPVLRLPGKPTPFHLFFGRDARTQLDATHPEIDGGDFRGGMDIHVAENTLRQTETS